MKSLKKYLNYETIKFLNEGFRSRAYNIDNKYIFLEGINENSYISFKDDKDKLDFLKDKINNIDIPKDVILIEKDAEFKFGGLIYPMIKGKVFNYDEINKYNLNAIAKSLSDFLNQLHSIKTKYNKKEIIDKERESINYNVSLLKKYLNNAELDKVLKWKEKYFKYLSSIKSLSLVHGDLWYENLILSQDGKALNGIIDFENMTTFIREVDLVPTLYINEEFLDKILKNYKFKVKKEEIYLLYQRREIISFKFMADNFPEEIDEQLDKIKEILDNYNLSL